LANTRKGIFFSLDALFALFILLSLITLLALLSFESTSQEMSMVSLHSQAGDAVDVLATTTLGDISHEPIARQLYSAQLFSREDNNKTLLDVIGTLWSTDDAQNITLASNVSQLIAPLLPENVHWAFLIGNYTLYNSSPIEDGRFVTGVSRRLASGYQLSEPVEGFVARAFLSTILGRQASSYVFFGGFVGQGNLTTYVRDIPSNSSIQNLFVELNLGSNAELYVNSNFCSTLIKSPGLYTVDNWTLTSCIDDILPGQDNEFTLFFTGSNQSVHFLGGGFIRVTYNTGQMAPPVTGTMRYYFPGIDGVINLYDSFYVPGTINAMTAHIHFLSTQEAILNMGNSRMMTANGSDSEQTIDISNAELDAILDYANISLITVPLRMGIIANDTGEGNMSNADVILITDISGSMNWRIGYGDSYPGVQRACNNPDLYDSDTQRLSLAKCVDKTFVNIVLNTSGPRIGLVAFSTNANNYDSLTNNSAYLEGRIEGYGAGGGTCICCAINRAYNILNSESYPGRSKYIIVMTDGIAGNRCTDTGGWTYDDSPTWYTRYAVEMTGTEGQSVGSSGRIVRRTAGNWQTQSSPTSRTLYGIDFQSSSQGFAVGYRGRIIEWNGASWSIDSSPTSSSLYGVSYASASHAFGVGSSGRIVEWDGNSWSTASSPTSRTLRGMDMYDENLGFAVGDNGRIIEWDGSSWSIASSPTSYSLRGVSILSSTFAIAVGDYGRIIEWDGSSWSIASSPTSYTLRGIEVYNTTLAFAVGSSGRIVKWDGSSWSTEASPTGSTLYGVSFAADNLAFAVGSSGRIIRWDSDLSCNGTSTIGTYSCGGGAGDCNTAACECASNNAVYSSGRAASNLNATVYSIGFGPVDTCALANTTLQGIADAGNGTYYHSSDPEELMEIYQALAHTIINQSFSGQITMITGNMSSELFPDSYIEFNFTPELPTLGYREIGVQVETPRFASCQGGFSIPGQFNVSEIKATSYSADYWTDNVSFLSSATGGSYLQVFKLSDFGATYQDLGDPFIVQFSPTHTSSNETNSIYISTGAGPFNSSPSCSEDNRVIYTARFAASVSYGPVLPAMEGHNVTVYYDLDHDGLSDGQSYVSYGEDLPGFDPAPVDVSQLDTTNNALDEAFMRLLDRLNFIVPAGNSGLSGSATNPVDVQLSEEVSIQTNSLSEVPYMWGPVDMGVALWR